MTASPSQSNQIPESDIELLSAYLDDQLSAVERRLLEQRLNSDVRLRGELADLRATAQAVRALPTISPPRSFTLDPAQVAPRRFWLPTWVMQFSSGLSALALVVFTTLGLMSGPQAAAVFPYSDGMAGAEPVSERAAEPAAATAAPAATLQSRYHGASRERTGSWRQPRERGGSAHRGRRWSADGHRCSDRRQRIIVAGHAGNGRPSAQGCSSG
ncbi:anti-sigma factor [Candidatus Gracilibacteria bacterium]|nr:anti-sigma factor [Candidatus Gracilibacteria bacterium]